MSPKDPKQPKRTTRAEQDIFDDLASLCRLPGYVHAIALFCIRDTFISYADAGIRAEDMLPMFSWERLIRTELSTLIGLLIKGEIDFALPSAETIGQFVAETEGLLMELHDSMNAAYFEGFDPDVPGSFKPFANAKAFREPIFYGGDSAYPFQYRDFSAKKYANDTAWLRDVKGFTIDEAVEVARSVAKVTDRKVGSYFQQRSADESVRNLLLPLTFTAQEIAAAVSLDADLVRRVLRAFAVPNGEKNLQFSALQDFNIATACPLLTVADGEYVLFQQYSLFECLYESPFFWMGADKAYCATAMQHRGKFTEDISRSFLEAVFGATYVYSNVDIIDERGKTAGEIDVLVLFGDRAVVLQAKSKRLTIEARKGNDGMLRDDFKKSVQDSYDQGYKCARLLTDPEHRCVTAGTNAVPVPRTLKEIYVLCVVADHYPALAFQARQFLVTQADAVIQPPYVLDVFTLDATAEMLASPLHLLSYIKRRTGYGHRISSAHEMTILSYHLKKNLWLDEKFSMVALDDDISTDLSVAMTVRREGVAGRRTPSGLLTKLPSTRVGKIIERIEGKPDPATISLGLMLLTLGGEAIEKVSLAIDKIISMAQRDGKAHDLTFPLDEARSGVTIHCNSDPSLKAGHTLQVHCENRKHIHKADTWFGICLSPAGAVRGGVSLEFPSEADSEMDDRVAAIPQRRARRVVKIGRNDPCPCGSGKKYKKCCV